MLAVLETAHQYHQPDYLRNQQQEIRCFPTEYLTDVHYSMRLLMLYDPSCSDLLVIVSIATVRSYNYRADSTRYGAE